MVARADPCPPALRDLRDVIVAAVVAELVSPPAAAPAPLRPDSTPAPDSERVPCGGCTRCCENDVVRLLFCDDADRYQTTPHPFIPGALALARQADGDCVYLDRASGCTIHAAKPTLCRSFDCRQIAATIPLSKARKLSADGLLKFAVWQRGRELIRGSKAAA